MVFEFNSLKWVHILIDPSLLDITMYTLLYDDIDFVIKSLFSKSSTHAFNSGENGFETQTQFFSTGQSSEEFTSILIVLHNKHHGDC